jgi:hypothetical protein
MPMRNPESMGEQILDDIADAKPKPTSVKSCETCINKGNCATDSYCYQHNYSEWQPKPTPVKSCETCGNPEADQDLREMKHFDGGIQIYAQEQWHDEAVIIANKEALLRLKAVIEKALETGEAHGKFWASDGEGYAVVVKVLGGIWTDITWNTLSMPYMAEFARRHGENLQTPLSLCTEYIKELNG